MTAKYRKPLARPDMREIVLTQTAEELLAACREVSTDRRVVLTRAQRTHLASAIQNAEAALACGAGMMSHQHRNAEGQQQPACEWCAAEISERASGRYAPYCSEQCRQAAESDEALSAAPP